jgi:hypothetical protein
MINTMSLSHHRYGRLTRGFFGREHIEAFISLVGYSHMQRLVDAIMQMISERLQKLSLYVSALLDHLPVEHNVDKDLSEHATKEYRRLFSTFEDLLDFDDLKPEVFQSFREIGNAVVFIRNLSEALETAAQSEFINLSPLLGLVPDSKQTDKRLYVFCSMSSSFFSCLWRLCLCLFSYLSNDACLRSLTPHGTSLTIISLLLNQSTQYLLLITLQLQQARARSEGIQKAHHGRGQRIREGPSRGRQYHL